MRKNNNYISRLCLFLSTLKIQMLGTITFQKSLIMKMRKIKNDADKQYFGSDNNNQYQIPFSDAAALRLFPFMSHIFITNRSFLIYEN